MDRPDVSLIPMARRLAELLASNEGAQTLAQMQKLMLASLTGRATGANRPTGVAAAAQSTKQHVGIWQRDTDTAPWVREKARKSEWRYWADIDEIPVKDARKRVLFLGESVARGYLFDPWLTPAMVLERMLNDGQDGARFEIVDLARTDMTFRELVPLVLEAPALEPDALVLFAGNNWENVNYTPQDYQRLADAVRQGGFPACQRAFTDHVLLPACRAVLDLIAATGQTLGIPVVLIIPEVNLREWRNDPAALAPTLAGGANKEWLQRWALAQSQFAAGRFEAAAALLREMIELDGGSGGPSQSLLGECLFRLDRPTEARAAFEAARDAVCGIFVRHAPLCPSAVQQVERAKAKEHGFALVDLPKLFAEHLDGELPDRRLFLDYCHLNRTGIQLAMASAAAQLAGRIGGAGITLERFLNVDQQLQPECTALTHFLAAIHNAHYGQNRDVLLYHCRQAIGSSPEVVAAMRSYLDFQSRRAPNWMCQSYEAIKDQRAVNRYLSPEDAGTVDKFADFDLNNCITQALRESGIDVAPWHDEHVRREHAGRPTNLLSSCYRAATFWDRSGHASELPRAYYQAVMPVTNFFLVCDELTDLTLHLTCRVRGHEPAPDYIKVRINGDELGRVLARPTWVTHVLALQARCLRSGVNRIDLEWPSRTPAWQEDLERAARSLERGNFPEVLPVLGEIFAFVANARTS